MELIDKLKNQIPDLKKAEIEGLLNLLVTQKGKPDLSESGLPKETLRLFMKAVAPLLEGANAKTLPDLNPKPYKWSLLETKKYLAEEGGAISTIEKLKEIRKKYGLLPKRELDQFFALPETSVKKPINTILTKAAAMKQSLKK